MTTAALTLTNGANWPIPWTVLSIAILAAAGIAWVAELFRVNRALTELDQTIALAAVLFLAALGWMFVATLQEPPPDPSAAWQTIMRIAAYAAVFWVSLRALSDAAFARFFVDAFALFAGLICLSALGFFAFGVNPLLEEEAPARFARGPFVNANAFAFFANLGLLAAAASVDRRLRRSVEEVRVIEVLRALSGTSAWLFALVALIAAIAVAVSGSRAGLLLSIAGLAVYALVRPGMPRDGSSGLAASGRFATLGGVFIVLLLAIAIGGEQTLGELGQIEFDRTRGAINATALAAILERPLTGYGAGSFQEVVRARLPLEIAGWEWDKAHNIYLETAVELGIPAAACFFGALGVMAFRIMGAIRRRRRRRDLVALPAAVLVIGTLHSAVDFPLQMPVNAVFFLCLLAVVRPSEASGAR